MNVRAHRLAAVALALIAAGIAGSAGSQARAEGQTIRLFNGKNLDGWYSFIENPDGMKKNHDPDHVFTIEDGGVIHVRSHHFGYLSTEKEYENYRFSLEFKWGTEKYGSRKEDKRDAGVLYHCVGADKVWMKSLEFQIQEGDCGDMWLTGGEGGAPSLSVNGKTYTGGRVEKWLDNEKPNGQWNKIEIVARGGHIEHFINGKVNLVGNFASLTRGRINIQSEGAELYYRNIELTPL